jgi:raw
MPKYEVFLGGSCNPTTWRQDTAIPLLKKLGITFYNPQVSHWGPELVELEWKAKQHATVLFFVMDNETRSVASLIEAAHSAAKQRKLILVIHPYAPPPHQLCGETLCQR